MGKNINVLLFVVGLVFFPSTLLFSAVYKWIDDAGNIHFSDVKPSHQLSETIVKNKKNPANYNLSLEYLKNKHNIPEPSLQKTTEKDSKAAIVADNSTPITILFNSPSYEVSNKDKQNYRYLANLLYRAFQKELNWPSNLKLEITVHFFNKVELYSHKQNNQIKHTLSRSHYSLSRNEIVISNLDKKTDSDITKTLMHELSHAITRLHIKRIPSWLNEGIAMRMSNLEPHQGSYRIKKSAKLAKAIKYSQRNGDITSLYNYFQMPSILWREVEPNRRSFYYNVAWSIVEFMHSSEDKHSVLLKILKQAAINGDGIDEYKILNSHYSQGGVIFDSQWKKWIERQG